MDYENEERSSMESIMEYAQLIWRWAWLLVLAALIAGVGAYFLTNRQTRIYQASTLVMVNGASGASLDSYSSMYLGQQLATTYESTMLTMPVMQAVSEELGYEVTAKDVEVQTVSDTSLMKITVTSTDPQKAADIANALVRIFSEQVLEDQTSRYSELKAGIEEELTAINEQIASTQQKIINLNTDLDRLTAESEAASGGTDTGLSATGQSNKIATIQLTISQYQNSLSQYQQSRSYIVQSLQEVKLAEAQSVSSVIQKDPAVPDPMPIQPQPFKSAMLAAAVGFMLAAGVVFLVEFLNDTIRNPEEITRKWGLPVLGVIVNYNAPSGALITMAQPRAPVSESFRSLRTNIQFAGVNNPIHTLLVTSASPEDGKTSVVANLANVFAQNEKEVVVIDCDLRRPRIHKAFQLSNRLGLSDFFLRSQERLASIVKVTSQKRLCVVTSGSLPPNPSELLNSEKMTEVLSFLGKHFNTIILDSPPLLAVTDALVLSSRVDGVVLVMDPAKTKRAAIKHCIEQLRVVNANVLGVVLNNVKAKQSHYYNRKYYYGKQYGKAIEETGTLEEIVPEKPTENKEKS